MTGEVPKLHYGSTATYLALQNIVNSTTEERSFAVSLKDWRFPVLYKSGSKRVATA
jgi:hypothetical protein